MRRIKKSRVKSLILIVIFSIAGCERAVEPTIENINEIFATQDFSIEFRLPNAQTEKLSFREDYVTYQSPDLGTIRKTISFEDAQKANTFVQKSYRNRQGVNQENLPRLTISSPNKSTYFFIPISYSTNWMKTLKEMGLR